MFFPGVLSRSRQIRNRCVIAANLLAISMVTEQSLFAQTGPGDGGAGDENAPKGFFDIVFSGGIVGATFILVLLILSMFAAYLIFDHLMTIRRKDLMPEGLSDQVRQCLL